MKFIGVLCVVFGVMYAAIAVHYLNFDRQTRVQNLENLGKNLQDARLSTSFISPKYKGFVYAK